MVDSKAMNGRNNSIQSPLHVAVLADKPHNIKTLLQGNVGKRIKGTINYIMAVFLLVG